MTFSHVQCLLLCYHAEVLPHDLWAYASVCWGLADPDPEVREMALSVAALGCPEAWRTELHEVEAFDPEPHLRRYAAFVLDSQRSDDVSFAS